MVLHLPGAKGYSTKMGLLCAELLLLQIGHDQPFTLFKKISVLGQNSFYCAIQKLI